MDCGPELGKRNQSRTLRRDTFPVHSRLSADPVQKSNLRHAKNAEFRAATVLRNPPEPPILTRERFCPLSAGP